MNPYSPDRGRRLALAAGAALCLAAAADPADRLPQPAQEARARHLFQETRCLVCQGESIDDSEAGFSRDVRAIIRHDVAQGWSDSRIRAFLSARYGNFILFRPPTRGANLALWGGPFVVAILGFGLLLSRRGQQEPTTPLSSAEERRLAALENVREN